MEGIYHPNLSKAGSLRWFHSIICKEANEVLAKQVVRDRTSGCGIVKCLYENLDRFEAKRAGVVEIATTGVLPQKLRQKFDPINSIVIICHKLGKSTTNVINLNMKNVQNRINMVFNKILGAAM